MLAKPNRRNSYGVDITRIPLEDGLPYSKQKRGSNQLSNIVRVKNLKTCDPGQTETRN